MKLRLLQVAISIGLIALLLWRVDLNDVRASIAEIHPGMALAVVALNAPIALLLGVRSQLVLRTLGARVPMQLALPAAILGNVAGSLTPASAGELLRAAVLRSHAEITVEDALALVIYERAISVLLLALGTAVAAAFIFLPVAAAIGITAALLPVLAAPLAAGRLLRHVRHGDVQHGFVGRLRSAAGRLQTVFRDVSLLAPWSVITAGIFALIALQFWLLARGLDDAVSPGEAWLALGASQLAGIVSLLPLGIGAADGTLAALLRRAGMTFDQGAAVAVLVRATITLPLGLMAIVSYIYLSWRGPRGHTEPQTAPGER